MKTEIRPFVTGGRYLIVCFGALGNEHDPWKPNCVEWTLSDGKRGCYELRATTVMKCNTYSVSSTMSQSQRWGFKRGNKANRKVWVSIMEEVKKQIEEERDEYWQAFQGLADLH